MSGPERPKCLRHGRSDHDQCRGASKQIYGEEFHPVYFGPPDPRQYTGLTAYPGQGRDGLGPRRESDQDPSEGVPK